MFDHFCLMYEIVKYTESLNFSNLELCQRNMIEIL